MEARLREYRARQRRKELIENTKNKIVQSKDKLVDLLVPKIFRDMGKEREDEEVLLMEDVEPPPVDTSQPIEHISDVTSEVSELESLEEEEDPESFRYCIIKYTIIAIVWLLLYMYFLKIQFGAVFFVISMLIFICVNTRTKPRKRGEVSAYSVFNRNCRSIDGTLKAEQLQQQMMYGGLKPF